MIWPDVLKLWSTLHLLVFLLNLFISQIWCVLDSNVEHQLCSHCLLSLLHSYIQMANMGLPPGHFPPHGDWRQACPPPLLGSTSSFSQEAWYHHSSWPAPFSATSLIPPTTGKFLEELIKKWSLIQAQTSAINCAIKISAEAGCHLLWPDAIKDLCKKVNTLSINIDEVETCTHLRWEVKNDHEIFVSLKWS